MTEFPESTELQIDQWRAFLRQRQTVHAVDIDELEDHLRSEMDGLIPCGLDAEEAFLVAVRRMGRLDALGNEFAHVHTERMWKQQVLTRSGSGPGRALREAWIAFGLAAAAAVLVKLPVLFGWHPDTHGVDYALHAGLFVLPLLSGYFLWKRQVFSNANRLAGGFLAAWVLINLYPFSEAADTTVLAVLHLPIALWLLVGIAHAGGRWHDVGGRMDFVRFSGELFIYYVLIALGGGVLSAMTLMLFEAIGLDAEPFFESWLLPCGAAGAVLVAAWLVEAKKSVVENMAPVLTMLFTPMFVGLLLVFLAALALTGQGLDMEREVLIGFDLLLIVVLGLVLYSVSARDPHHPPGGFDMARILLLLAALIVDLVALSAIASRIGDMGLTPNRAAALGLNLVLAVNLAESARRYIGFQRGRRPFSDLERWQTDYLPVFAIWAGIVVVVFPPAFGFR